MLINKYYEFSLSRTGIMSSFPRTFWGAHFKLDADVSQLFPYINAIIEGAEFYDKPEFIQFILDDFRCTLYPNEVIATLFNSEAQAITFAERLIAFLNDLYVKKGEIKPNYKKIKPVPVIDIYKILPQTNCKECGFSTCLAFAAALSKGQTRIDQCPGLTSPISQYSVYPVFTRDGNLATTVAIEIDAQAPLRPKEAETVRTDLTNREMQVLRLVAAGATNMEISHKLRISPHTVKSHVVHILNKLGVNDRTEAAVWAARRELV
jgi:DNA-binding CsgD family transcriptional regulator/ArsR family metal-binding transcriptional regulator